MKVDTIKQTLISCLFYLAFAEASDDHKPQASGGSFDASASSAFSGSNEGDTCDPIITTDFLIEILNGMGFKNNIRDYVDATVKIITKENFENKENAAMFLGQCIHESGGFQYTEEIIYAENPFLRDNKYNSGRGLITESYNGRGPLQISWDFNYLEAGIYLRLGDLLLKYPGLVATDYDLGASCALWYWKEKVVKSEVFRKDPSFGSTTMAINGNLECWRRDGNHEVAKNRYARYKDLATRMGIENFASEGGCYPVN